MAATETILLEALLVDHAPPVVTRNPFKTKAKKPKATPGAKATTVGKVQLVIRKEHAAVLAGEAATDGSETSTAYVLRFLDVCVTNEKSWPLFVLLSRANVPLTPPTGKKKKRQSDDAQLRTLEAQGEVVPLDIGPGGQWVGAQLPSSFEQQIFVFDPLVFASIVICKPSAARPPTVLPQVVAHGVFSSYMKPEKSLDQVQAELDALASRLQNTVMEMEQTALEDDHLDLDTLQRNARDLFRLFDEDKSNSIDFDEYKQMLAYRGLNILDSKAMRLFQLVDDQKKGYIDEREFVVALYITNTLRQNAKKQVSQLPAVLSPVDVFYQLDSDRDGMLNVFEYEKAMNLLGVTRDASAVKREFPKSVAAVSMDQFKNAWLNLIDVHEELRKRGISARSAPSGMDDASENGGPSHKLMHLSLPFAVGLKKRQRESDRLKQVLMKWITQVEQDELDEAMKAKYEVCSLEKARRDQAQEEKRALFAQQRHTETATRTSEALRERQDKIERRKERVLKERQAREEKRIQARIAEEQEKRELHQRQVVQELMTTKMEKIVSQKAKHGDDVLDLSFRQLDEIPTAFYKGRDAINSLSSLLIISVPGNRLRSLPSAIFPHLFALQVLDVSDNQLDQIPHEIGEARDLKVLDVHHNRIHAVPPTVRMLRSLEVLNLAHNSLESFGDIPAQDSNRRESYCDGLVALEDLDLSYNDTLMSVSEAVGELQALKVFRMRGCMSLKKLPDAFHRLRSLVSFDISASMQKRIGKHVFGPDLKTLGSLNLSFNNLSSLPDALGKLPSLQELNVSNNALMAFPDHLSALRELVVFHGSKNQMDKLPDRIGEMTSLEILDLSRNALRSPLPPTMGLLTFLHTLHLHHNHLSEIPMEFGALINVRVLDLSWNEITHLPEEIGCMASVKSLNLSHNKLRELPESIVLWQDLEMLVCSDNALVAPLSPSFEHLASLKYLDLSQNALTGLDPCLYHLPAIEVLNLSGNKLSLLPRELVDAPAGGSLRKLDLYNNKIMAIPVEWSSLMARLDVLSIGRNPMSLLPEKWSDHWRHGKWQRGDVYATSSMHGYTPTQVKEWVHDTSAVYPAIVAVWKQQSQRLDGSDAFVKSVQSAVGSDEWQHRYERIVRHYFYEFKYAGHEILLETIPQDQRAAFDLIERQLRDQQTQRADNAIAQSNAFREKLDQAYAYDEVAHRRAMEKRRRVHEVQQVQDLRLETRQWNEVVSEKRSKADERRAAALRDRQKRFADEMKEAARLRMLVKQQRTVADHDDKDGEETIRFRT